jgi:hypothetical protein
MLQVTEDMLVLAKQPQKLRTDYQVPAALLRRRQIGYAIFLPMLQVTEDMLVLAKQPQKLLTDYQVPAAKVADMISEATTEITQNVNDNLNDQQDKKGEMGDLSQTPLFFAARRHRYKKNVYVVRIQYKFLKRKQAKNTYAVKIFHAEVVKEKDFQPILPL